MRHLTTLLLFLALATANSFATANAFATEDAVATPGPPATKQAILDFLLDSAAADFLKNGPNPSAFRNVRFGVIEGTETEPMYLVCGEVQPADGLDTGRWVEFATLKTSGYEQWLGSKGVGFCDRPGTIWEFADLSAELQRRVDESRPAAAPAEG